MIILRARKVTYNRSEVAGNFCKYLIHAANVQRRQSLIPNQFDPHPALKSENFASSPSDEDEGTNRSDARDRNTAANPSPIPAPVSLSLDPTLTPAHDDELHPKAILPHRERRAHAI